VAPYLFLSHHTAMFFPSTDRVRPENARARWRVVLAQLVGAFCAALIAEIIHRSVLGTEHVPIMRYADSYQLVHFVAWLGFSYVVFCHQANRMIDDYWTTASWVAFFSCILASPPVAMTAKAWLGLMGRMAFASGASILAGLTFYRGRPIRIGDRRKLTERHR
jgi:hypothetical protein